MAYDNRQGDPRNRNREMNPGGSIGPQSMPVGGPGSLMPQVPQAPQRDFRRELMGSMGGFQLPRGGFNPQLPAQAMPNQMMMPQAPQMPQRPIGGFGGFGNLGGGPFGRQY